MYYNNKRLILSIVWVVLGITLVVLSALELIPSGMYSGFGGGLAAVGALQILRQIRYRSNSEYKEKVDIELNDERNRYVRMKAWSWTGYICVLGSAIAVVASFIMGKSELAHILATCLCILIVVYWVCYMIILRRD